ncbi:MAG TPA: hypothetical protein ENI73_08720 [Spirochaetes bacterium]|nr:hypothetical protein [Spirochaetota bacterium]
MKKLIVIMIAVFALSFSTRMAQAFEIDGSFHYATEPINSMGDGFGGGIGVAFDLLDLGVGKLMGRFDVSYISVSKTISGTKFSGGRLPIFGGARFLFSASPMFKPYAEAGLEVSLDELTADTPGTATANETTVGLGAGGGINIYLGVFFVGVNARAHLNNLKSYLTISPTVGVSF